MQLVSKRNFMILLAAILVVALGYMAMSLSKRDTGPAPTPMPVYEGEPMSESDEVEEIEADLENTDLDSLDKDINDLDKELQNY